MWAKHGHSPCDFPGASFNQHLSVGFHQVVEAYVRRRLSIPLEAHAHLVLQRGWGGRIEIGHILQPEPLLSPCESLVDTLHAIGEMIQELATPGCYDDTISRQYGFERS